MAQFLVVYGSRKPVTFGPFSNIRAARKQAQSLRRSGLVANRRPHPRTKIVIEVR